MTTASPQAGPDIKNSNKEVAAMIRTIEIEQAFHDTIYRVDPDRQRPAVESGGTG